MSGVPHDLHAKSGSGIAHRNRPTDLEQILSGQQKESEHGNCGYTGERYKRQHLEFCRQRNVPAIVYFVSVAITFASTFMACRATFPPLSA